MEKIYQVTIIGLGGEKVTVDLCNTEEEMQEMTVKQLKEKIREKIPDLPDGENMKLFYRDMVLEGDSTQLSDYGITHMSVILIVLKLRGGGGIDLLPKEDENYGMGDKKDKTRWSMERLRDFQASKDKSDPVTRFFKQILHI